MSIQSLLDWLLADPSHLIATASALAALTPTPSPASVAGKLYRIIDIVALNFLHAKSGGSPPPDNPPPSLPPSLPAVALAAVLAACAQNPQANVFEIRAAYDATVLAPLVQYHALPPCPAASGVCKDSKVDQHLIQADAEAKTALDAAEDVVRNHPGTDPTALLNDAQIAVNAVKIILTQNGVK